MTAFGAGGGRRQFCCGAVSGALLVISLLKGENSADKAAQEILTLAFGSSLRFETEHGSSECRTLLDGINLLTPEGQERFVTEDMPRRCGDYVGSAVRILEEILGV